MSGDELLAEAERLATAEPTGGVGVSKAAALLEAAFANHQRDLRVVTRLMEYLREAGRERDAVKIGREVYQDNVEDAAFLYEFGVALRLSGLWREAMEVHTRAAASHRDDPEAQYAWAISQSVYGFPANMIHVVDELIRKYPDNMKYRYGRARILARMGRLREAVKQLEEILTKNPLMLDGKILLAKVEMVLRWDARWKATVDTILQPARPATRALWSFYLEAARGNIAAAQKQIAEAIRLDPGEAELFKANGRFLLELYEDSSTPEFLKLAIQSLTAATSLAPEDAEARGRLLEAEVIAGKSLDLGDARRDAEDRPHAGMPRYLARISAHREDSAESERWYRHWLAAFPEDVESWCDLGEVLLDMGRTDEAEKAFDQAADLSPEFAPPWNGLGYARFQRGEYGGAADAYGKALAAGAGDAGIKDAYGLALMETGRVDDAISQLREAVAKEPTEGLFHLHLAQTYEKAGRTAEAAKEARVAKQFLDGELRAEADSLLARLS